MTIATMPARIGSGRVGQAATRAARSGGNDGCRWACGGQETAGRTRTRCEALSCVIGATVCKPSTAGSNPAGASSRPNPSGTVRTRPSPSTVGVSGVSSFPDPGTTSRQNPTGTAPTRPLRATESATGFDTGLTPADPALAALVDAWPTLPEPIKAGIVAMVRAAAPGKGGDR